MEEKHATITEERNMAIARILEILTRVMKEDAIDPPEISREGGEAEWGTTGLGSDDSEARAASELPQDLHLVRHELAWNEVVRLAQGYADFYKTPEAAHIYESSEHFRTEECRRRVKESVLRNMDAEDLDFLDFFYAPGDEKPQSEGWNPFDDDDDGEGWKNA
jgi:hypothetical protein